MTLILEFPKRNYFLGQEQVQLTTHVPEEKVRLANIMKPTFHLNGVFAIFSNFQAILA
jgi:hypothetical protein